MKTIKSKIIVAFSAVILTMILVLLFVMYINFNLINQFNSVNENIVFEQDLKDNINNVGQDWYNGSKSGDFSNYYVRVAKIKSVQSVLNNRFIGYVSSQEVKVAHRSLNNSVTLILQDLEEARKNLNREDQALSAAANALEINIKLGFVQQNVTNLLVAETGNIAEITQHIKQQHLNVFTIVGSIIFIVSLVLVVLSLWFAKKISDPIVNLSKTARKISDGDLTLSVSQNLFKKRDEIGSLSRSFAAMIASLREKMVALEKSSRDLAGKMTELSKNNQELQSAQSAITNVLEDSRSLGENLKQERDRSEAIISSMGEGLVVVDKDNNIIMANPAAVRLLETPAEKFIGKNIIEAIPLFIGNDLIALEDHPIIMAVKSKKTIISNLGDDLYLSKSSGQKFSVFMVSAPLSFEEDSGAVVMFRDASEEKALDDAKIGFISIASHQLRTPLTSIRWFSEMLMDGDAGEINGEQKGFVELIYNGTERMINLVNLLLQIARVEAGRLKIIPVMIDFKNTTNGVVATLKTILANKEQTVEITTNPTPLPSIPMDQEVIWQVIQNLLSNASRYSPVKSVINVAVIKKDDHIEYSVKDSGIGIPEEYRPRIFEKFYRADNALKLVPEGSGLGLSLVKMLVERWGGKIWFESEEGKGTTFFFTIPFAGMKPKEGDVGLKV